MIKKIYLQFFILLLAVLLSFFFYKTYILKNNPKTQIKQSVIKQDVLNNTLENIEYISEDKKGNIFKITSKKGNIDTFNDKITKMDDVKSEIKLINNDLITITSQNAIYDRETNNSIFYGGVNINYNENLISSNKLELLFNQNLMLISENVIYQSPNSRLNTDRIEISLDTKNVKIRMNKKNDKVKIKMVN